MNSMGKQSIIYLFRNEDFIYNYIIIVNQFSNKNNLIMEKKNFPCKFEELPIIGGFILQSARQDLADFSAFSTVFTAGSLDLIDTKVKTCSDMVMSSAVSKELKMVTSKLVGKTTDFRVKLNGVEAYFKLASADLDIKVADTGIKEVRKSISSGDIEGVIFNGRKVLNVVKRNHAAMEGKGMKPVFVNEMELMIQEIEALNNSQDKLISQRGRLTAENAGIFNDLWKDLQQILDTARAMYRGVDDAKLKDYTMSTLIKRVNAEGKRDTKTTTAQ